MGNLQSFSLPAINFKNINCSCSCFNSNNKESPPQNFKIGKKPRYKFFICSDYKKIFICDHCAKLNKKNDDEYSCSMKLNQIESE